MNKRTKQHYTMPTVDIITPHHNFYAVMIFNTEQNLSISNDDQSLLNTSNIFFTNGTKAIEAFLHSPHQYTRLATGETSKELKSNMKSIINSINKYLKP